MPRTTAEQLADIIERQGPVTIAKDHRGHHTITIILPALPADEAVIVSRDPSLDVAIKLAHDRYGWQSIEAARHANGTRRRFVDRQRNFGRAGAHTSKKGARKP